MREESETELSTGTLLYMTSARMLLAKQYIKVCVLLKITLAFEVVCVLTFNLGAHRMGEKVTTTAFHKIICYIAGVEHPR